MVNKLLRKESLRLRASNVQARFKTDLCQSYDAVKANGPALNQDLKQPYQNQDIWCPVMGRYFGYHEITADHVMPYSMGELIMEKIFGSGHIVWSDQNGLLLHASIEKLLDESLITIVLENDDKKETGLKIRVLERNKNWLNKKVVMNFAFRIKDLQNQPLSFLNNHRLKRRYI